jgi:hypothetical protein
MLWKKTTGMAGKEYGTSLDISPVDSSVLLCGYRRLTGSDYPYKYIVLMDKEGNLKWQTTSTTKHWDMGGISGFFTSDNNILVSGDQIDSIPLISVWFYNGYLAKLDRSGKIIWENEVGSTVYSSLNTVFETKDGGFVYTGFNVRDNDSSKLTISHGWIGKLDRNGKKLWERFPYYNPRKDDNYLFDIKPTPDNGFIAVGVSRPLIDSIRDEDLWVVKTDSLGCEKEDCGFVGIEPGKERYTQSISIYPNPASNEIYFAQDLFDQSNEVTLCMYDLLGREVMRQKLVNSGPTQSVDASGLVPGTYVCVLLCSNGSAIRQKLVITH